MKSFKFSYLVKLPKSFDGEKQASLTLYVRDSARTVLGKLSVTCLRMKLDIYLSPCIQQTPNETKN